MSMRGFTFLETLIYISLFAVLMQGMFASLFAIAESSDRNETKAYLEEEGDFIADKISYEISQSTSATLESNGEIDLASVDDSESVHPSNGQFAISRDGSAFIPFSSNLTEVTQPEFSIESNRVSFSFVLSTLTQSGTTLSETFSRTSYFHL